MLSFTKASFLSIIASAVIAVGVTLAQSTSTQTPLPVLFCISVRVARTPHTQHAEFAARYYASRFPNLAVSTKLVGTWQEGGTNAIGLIRAWVVNGTGCNVLIGPGSSSLAASLNPLVTSLWMDYSATSTELSDKSAYPLFSRVAPNDAQSTAGAASLLRRFGWKLVNTLCADNAYGRSVVTGISDAVTADGGHIAIARCVTTSAGKDELHAALKEYMNGETRAVFVGMSTSANAFNSLLEVVLEEEYHKQLVFIFSESACSGSAITWQRIPGSFCGTFSVNNTFLEPFLSAYRSRDTSSTDAQYASFGFPPSEVSKTSSAVFPVYAADASLFSLHIVSEFYRQHGRAPNWEGEIAEFARKQTYLGASGQITLATNGDRLNGDFVVFNAQPGNQSVLVANVTGPNITIANRMYFLGSGFRTNSWPSATLRSTATSQDNGAIIGGIVALIVVILIVAVLLVVVRFLTKPTGRDNDNAPKDNDKPLAMVFTDVQASTHLWSNCPEEMSAALDLHHDTIRDCVAAHNGYEVKTIGDSFMVAFKAVDDAVKFALSVQQQLFYANWSTQTLDNSLRQKIKEQYEIEMNDADYNDCWSGLRVRVGVHYATASVIFDPVSQGYDYYGTCVNQAARIEGVAHGGQILVSEEVLNALTNRDKTLYQTVVEPLGPQPLRGINEPVPLTQILPVELSGRKFPPLRLDVENEIEEEEEGINDNATNKGAGGDAMSVIVNSTFEIVQDTSRMAKRNKLPTLRLYDHQRLFNAIVSPFPLKERKQLVISIADKWRLNSKKIVASYSNEEDAVQALLLHVSARASLVTMNQEIPPRIMEMSCHGSERSGSRRPSLMRGSLFVQSVNPSPGMSPKNGSRGRSTLQQPTMFDFTATPPASHLEPKDGESSTNSAMKLESAAQSTTTNSEQNASSTNQRGNNSLTAIDEPNSAETPLDHPHTTPHSDEGA